MTSYIQAKSKKKEELNQSSLCPSKNRLTITALDWRAMQNHNQLFSSGTRPVIQPTTNSMRKWDRLVYLSAL
jgi:hypothetical protein